MSARELVADFIVPVVGALMSFRIVTPSLWLAVVLALALLAIDVGACFVVARLFDRERLITGAQPSRRRDGHAAEHP